MTLSPAFPHRRRPGTFAGIHACCEWEYTSVHFGISFRFRKLADAQAYWDWKDEWERERAKELNRHRDRKADQIDGVGLAPMGGRANGVAPPVARNDVRPRQLDTGYTKAAEYQSEGSARCSEADQEVAR